MPSMYKSYAMQFTHFIDENQAEKQKNQVSDRLRKCSLSTQPINDRS